ncbi:OsmC family protein [Streptomyces canus]|uniref:OsmC family protein n=1 Tax=Streptomyces canus TaxID=58343 RepID=UPI0022505DA2|nr:OsmC family protein [Streptomyces canus]MCX4859051.1 OsmC family protein [Streptomyces canus]WSW35727.1 OsmC family protein [Streptomyces canus]
MTTTPQARTSYRVRARTTPDGPARIEAAEQTIPVDAAWAEPPSGQPGPAELLAASLAACLLKNLNRSSKLLPFRYTSAEVDVVAGRQDTPPKFTHFTYELRLVTDEPQRRIDLLHHNLRRYGTVYNTLAATCDIQGRIVTTPSPPEPS